MPASARTNPTSTPTCRTPTATRPETTTAQLPRPTGLPILTSSQQAAILAIYAQAHTTQARSSTPPPPYSAPSTPPTPTSPTQATSPPTITIAGPGGPRMTTPQEIYRKGVIDGMHRAALSPLTPNQVRINISNAKDAAKGAEMAAALVSRIEQIRRPVAVHEAVRPGLLGGRAWNVELNLKVGDAAPAAGGDAVAVAVAAAAAAAVAEGEEDEDDCFTLGAPVGGKRRAGAAGIRGAAKKARK